MARDWLLGVLIPGNQVRSVRRSHSSVHAWTWGGTFRPPADRGRSSVCFQGSRRRLQGWNLSGDRSRSCGSCNCSWCHLVFRIYRMAGVRRGQEGPIRGKLEQAIQALEQRIRSNGVSLRVCSQPAGRRPSSFDGYREGVSVLAAGPKHARLVPLQVSWALLSLSSVAFRLGKIPNVVYAAHDPICNRDQTNGIPSSQLYRRLFDFSFPAWSGSIITGLRRCHRLNRQAYAPYGSFTTGNQGRMDWITSCEPSWRGDRHEGYEVLYPATEDREGSAPCKAPLEGGSNGPSVGRRTGTSPLLWFLRVPNSCFAVGPLLHPFSLLGPIEGETGRQREKTTESSSGSRPPQMAQALQQRALGTLRATSQARCFDAHRRCRSRIRGYFELRGFQCWGRRALEGAGSLELARSCIFHLIPRTKGSSKAALQPSWVTALFPREAQPTSPYRQSSSRSHRELLCFVQPPNDARAAAPQACLRPAGTTDTGRVDPIGSQSLRRCIIATVSSRRPPDSQAADAFRAGWYEGAARSISLPATRRTPRFSPSPSIPRIRHSLVYDVRSSSVMPATGPHTSDGGQVDTLESPSSAAPPRVASSTLVPSRATNSATGQPASTSPVGSLGSTAQLESSMAFDGPRNQPVTRSATRMYLASAGANRAQHVAGDTAGAVRALELISQFAWSPRTAQSRNSQWETWVQFCTEEQRSILPVTEGHLVAFIGWLALAREKGTRRVGSSSIPQYLSAVKQMQLLLTGESVPSFPFVSHVMRAYSRWEESNYPNTEVRCGVPAAHVQKIWALGMSSTTTSVVRDCAIVVWAYSFNGLRDSSVTSQLSSNVSMDGHMVTARLSVVKGKRASHVALITYHRPSDFPSPYDLWERWRSIRGNHPRFFALPGESVDTTRSTLNEALKRSLQMLGLNPPTYGKFTSHSLRIGSHTEQVLLGISLPVRLAKFGWGHNSDAMASLYFDRTLRTTAESFWFFGRDVVPIASQHTPVSTSN